MGTTLYPLGDEEEDGKVRLSVTLTKEQYADLIAAGKIWDAIDKALGKKRQKWKLTRVLSRFLDRARDIFWDELGGRPASAEDLDKFVAQAVERIKQRSK